MYITMEEAKAQLSILEADTTHDDRISRLIDAAEAWATQVLDKPLSDFEDGGDESPPVSSDSPSGLPEDIKSALLLHVEAHFDRDPQTMAEYIKTAGDLLYPHRKLGL